MKAIAKDILYIFKMVLIIALPMAIMLMPMMTMYADRGMGVESIIINAATLYHFNLTGLMIWVTPIFLTVILISKCDYSLKKILFIITGVLNLLSYALCIYDAKNWLFSLGGKYVAYHYSFVFYPVWIIIATCLLCCEMERESQDDECIEDFELGID